LPDIYDLYYLGAHSLLGPDYDLKGQPCIGVVDQPIGVLHQLLPSQFNPPDKINLTQSFVLQLLKKF
jgi:hypothetical protein